jgi:hypothetical protein
MEAEMTARHGSIPCPARSALAAGLAALLGCAIAPAGAADPVKIAVFPFELRDLSGSSGILAPDAVNADYLSKATEEARRLLQASGRYRIVDTAAATADPAAAQGIQHCHGCEAALARTLGADQSMAGLVTRVTPIVYTVQIVVRNADTGALVSNHYTDSRLGANYAWPRGVKWLMDNQLLASRPSP